MQRSQRTTGRRCLQPHCQSWRRAAAGHPPEQTVMQPHFRHGGLQILLTTVTAPPPQYNCHKWRMKRRYMLDMTACVVHSVTCPFTWWRDCFHNWQASTRTHTPKKKSRKSLKKRVWRKREKKEGGGQGRKNQTPISDWRRKRFVERFQSSFPCIRTCRNPRMGYWIDWTANGPNVFEHDNRGSHPSTMQQWQHSPAGSVGRWHGAAANHLDDSVFSIMSVLTSDNHRLVIIVGSDDIPHNTEIGIDYGSSFGSMSMTFSMPSNPPKVGVLGAATVHNLQETTVDAQQTAGHGCSTRPQKNTLAIQ